MMLKSVGDHQIPSKNCMEGGEKIDGQGVRNTFDPPDCGAPAGAAAALLFGLLDPSLDGLLHEVVQQYALRTHEDQLGLVSERDAEPLRVRDEIGVKKENSKTY